MIDYRVYLVTDDPSRYRGDWLENVRAAVEGGVTCVQYRDTESEPHVQYARIRRLQDALHAFKTPLIVNNDPDLAVAVGAEGVHVGQHDAAPRLVRSRVGPKVEIGLSITSSADLTALLETDLRNVVDVIGIGPVFDARKTKADAAGALGLQGLRQIVHLAPEIRNCAIGGLTLANSADVLAAGAKGLAVVSAFSKSENPYEVAHNFSLLFDHRRQ